jgi:hypothetical protein
MRIFLIFSFLCASVAISFAQSKAKVASKKINATAEGKVPAGIKFNDTFYEFGTIKQGDVVTHEFEFTNFNKKPFVINSATATCGCTTPSYPFIPIGPGETGTIGITFNSKTKLGNQTPTVTVSSNLGTFKLYMKGIVTD